MTLPLAVQHEIVQRLKPLEPAKVILFGSYAKGTATEESDIDLAVVVPGRKVESHKEQMERYLPIAKSLRLLNEQYSIDIIVHSTDECVDLEQRQDGFWREVEESGEVLYAR
jgi:predicted nucleotidyltransferase